VRWDAEVTKQDGSVAVSYDVLTMVSKEWSRCRARPGTGRTNSKPTFDDTIARDRGSSAGLGAGPLPGDDDPHIAQHAQFGDHRHAAEGLDHRARAARRPC